MADPKPPWVYANRVWISYNSHGFNLDCIHVLPFTADCKPENEEAITQARIMMSPVMGKLLMTMLTDQVTAYEAKWGTIPVTPNVDIAKPASQGEDEEDDEEESN